MAAVFRYSNPATVYWGRGSISNLATELGQGAPVAVVTTRSLLDGPVLAVVRRLVEVGPVVTIGQHAPTADIDRATEAARAAGVAALVSVGGGSPIDAAKIVSLRCGQLPHVAVPTTLSAAELAAGAGYTDGGGNKLGVRDPAGLPRAVVYDADLAVQTPLELWLSTGIRSLDHAVEGFLAPGEHPYNDALSLEAVRRLFRTLPLAQAAPADPDIRGENQVAAWLSYSLVGPTAGGLSHVMGKQVSARHGIPHGVSSCILLPHVLRYRLERQPDRAQPLADAMAGDPPLRVRELIGGLGLPSRLRAYGLTEPDLQAAAQALASDEYPAADLLSIYRAAF